MSKFTNFTNQGLQHPSDKMPVEQTLAMVAQQQQQSKKSAPTNKNKTLTKSGSKSSDTDKENIPFAAKEGKLSDTKQWNGKPYYYSLANNKYSHWHSHKVDNCNTGDVKEEIPEDTPKLLGNRVVTTTFLDANLHHDIVTEKSVTEVLHFINTTPIDWYSKRQATVKTARYGSELVAARTATEQIMDLRNMHRYLGVPIMTKADMFSNNKSVITSVTIPQSVLNKRHNMLSYHRVREAITAKILDFYWCSSDQNKSDILSKQNMQKSRIQLWNYLIIKEI